MFCHGGTVLTRSEPAVLHPPEPHPRPPASLLDGRLVCRLEEVLPTHIEAGCEVADIHELLPLKLFADLRAQSPVNCPAVNDRRRAALGRRLYAEEPLLQ